METSNKNTDFLQKEQAYLLAKDRVKKIKGFYGHLFWYVVVNLAIIVIAGIINAEHFNLWEFNTYSTAVFWGFGLAAHGLMVFGKNLLFSKAWEERKIQEYLDKEKNK